MKFLTTIGVFGTEQDYSRFCIRKIVNFFRLWRTSWVSGDYPMTLFMVWLYFGSKILCTPY